MKKYKILLLTALLTLTLVGCKEKETAPNDSGNKDGTEDVARTGDLKLSLMWFNETEYGVSVTFEDKGNTYYTDKGIDQAIINIGGHVDKEVLGDTELLYGQDYKVTYEDNEITAIEVDPIKDPWENILQKDKTNAVILQGLDTIDINAILTELHTDLDLGIQLQNDNNTVKSVRDYAQHGIEKDKSGVAIFQGYEFQAFLTTPEDVEEYKAIISKD